MASKGQKFKKVDPKIKKEILKKYFEGDMTPSVLEKEYKISYHTIRTWIFKHNKGIDITVDHHKGRSGRPKTKNLTLEDYKERYEILKKYQAFLEARQEKK